MLATAREQSRAFFMEGLIMSLLTKLAITGLGVAVLMLLAFLTPVDAMARSHRDKAVRLTVVADHRKCWPRCETVGTFPPFFPASGAKMSPKRGGCLCLCAFCHPLPSCGRGRAARTRAPVRALRRGVRELPARSAATHHR